MFDPLVVNPAYAGTHVQLSATGIYRNQWVNFDGAPKTFTATMHSGFKKARVGVGILLGKDVIGVHNENNLYGIYSYKLPLSRRKNSGILSFGIQGGFNSLKSDYGKTIARDGMELGAITKVNPNFGGGIFYRGKYSYAGISVPYILNSTTVEVIGEQGLITPSGRQQRYYYMIGGFTKKLSEIVKWSPSTLVRIQKNAPVSFDLNSLLIFYDIVSIGGSYRLSDSVVGLFELQINSNFHVGYAYDITTSAIRLYSNGSHEIMINYRIKIPAIHKGVECPSYW
jgi:type IX secretion system PorP/SprF family membrane protein